jgi:hypothetical protein
MKERAFVAWMAPRGIVAAAISAVFALRLEQEGYAEASQLVPYTFIVIIATVTIYGLTASPVARLLKVAKPDPNGVIILGAHKWARKIADMLKDSGFKVLLADSNWENVSTARKSGIDAYYGNILSEYAADEIDLEGIGKMLSLTPNDEVNSLASIHFSEIFSNSHVFQLSPTSSAAKKGVESGDSLGGRTLFSKDLNFDKITSLLETGAEIEKKPIANDFKFEDFKKKYGENAIPLFSITSNDNIEPFSLINPPSPQPGDTIIALIMEDVDSKNSTSDQTDD